MGYHEDDFNGIGATQEDNQLWARLNEQYNYSGLHNGNIAWMQTHLAGMAGEEGENNNSGMQAMLYQYDQLNRLVLSRSLSNYSEGTGFASRNTSGAEAFDTDYSYDANGNLLNLQRYNQQASLRDDYTYNYAAGTNKLTSLGDSIPADTIWYDSKTYDSGVIKSDGKVYREITVEGNTTADGRYNAQLRANEVITLKPDFHATAGSGFHAKWVDEANYEIDDDNATYQYDEIGNLISDSSDGVKISWTPYGKVRQVKHNDSTQVTYRYDGAGNRILKAVDRAGFTHTTTYVRDASGNVLAIYQDSTLAEQPIYGSSRLGMYKGGTAAGHETLGKRQYELYNHLGNVLAVITDNINMDADSTWATVTSLHDYYPFGMEMEGRSYIADVDDENYRFGFNGKMKDNSFGSTNYDYGFRIYSPKIGKFLSVDPLTKSYPMLTPYQFASNTPIQAVDLDGLEAYHFHSLGMYTKFTSMIEGKSESEVMAIASNMYYGVNDWINKEDKLQSMEKGWGADSEYNMAITRNNGGPFRVFAPGDNVASIHHATDKLEEIRQGELQKRQAAYEKAVFKMYDGISQDIDEREFNLKLITNLAIIEGALASFGSSLYASGGVTLANSFSVGLDFANIAISVDDIFGNFATENFDQNDYSTFKLGVNFLGIGNNFKSIFYDGNPFDGINSLNFFNDLNGVYDYSSDKLETQNSDEKK